jgi:hypothetical protein
MQMNFKFRKVTQKLILIRDLVRISIKEIIKVNGCYKKLPHFHHNAIIRGNLTWNKIQLSYEKKHAFTAAIYVCVYSLTLCTKLYKTCI